ncbi:putative necrosis-inducing factor-domain-containing protein [Colletotrichum navitas]|uniref:Necrosis-inducing factor-domain-containing protein n=1 Tax=Colletotrichum navitas TaxID=681940 RepID=A0AAD8PNU5_9PEZI|nr:putative necrosis-inducing factor-domain-containing protein [Colletotrichum navitas]KAK1573622.1 putative necrosis-inducing factor-domain-containing protein [Colletotrichum navitas]
MVPRTFINADGTDSTIHVNRRLQFTQGSESTRPTRLSKRVVFSPGRVEWCGEVAEDPATDFSASAPSAEDCQALINSLGDQDGFWTLQPNDFSSDGWARIVSSGSCAFAARYADSGSTGNPMRIGTNDILFYTTRYLPLAQNGKLGLQGTVQCNNAEKMLFVTWGLLSS